MGAVLLVAMAPKLYMYVMLMYHICFTRPCAEVTNMAQTMEPVLNAIDSQTSRGARTKEDIRYRIAEIGVIPAVRVASEQDALFVAEALAEAGIPIVEISAAFPSAFHTISYLAERLPNTIVGAGSIMGVEMARRCLDEGAEFLTTDGLVLNVVEFAGNEGVVVFPGALTPTEIIAAWNAGSDFVKVVPCNAVGGHNYIRSLKSGMPQIHLIAAGGVDQRTACNFIAAGATALGVGRDLIPAEAIRLRQAQRIQELARRFLGSVDNGRN